MTAAFLEVIGLSKQYGARRALDDVSFSVASGEMFGLLGPNGAGKTTLLSIVSCLLGTDGGEVRLDGRKLDPTDRSARRLIGVVPQELAVYAELTAQENLTFFGELYGIRGPELRRRVGEILDAIGLADRADQRVSTFSGGMKRRLNLGAALVHRPALLLLDEPTAGVDPQSRNHLFEEVRRLNATGVTIVYTSHYMEEVQGLCTRIGIMDRGHLVACDTLPHLLQMLEGVIRFRLGFDSSEIRAKIGGLPDLKCAIDENGQVQLYCRDVPGTLMQLGALGVEALDVTIEEPNLERVFLHLTGTKLRDDEE